MKKAKKETAKKHPLELISKELEEYGVVVIDNVIDMPYYDEPYVSPYMIIAISNSGYIKAEYDQREAVFSYRDISLVPPKHIIRGGEISDDYSCTLIVLSSKTMEHMRQYVSYRNYFVYHNEPSFHLSEEQYESICNIVNLLRSTYKLESPQRQHIVMHILELLYMLVDEYRFTENNVKPAGATPLFVRFYDLLTENYTKSREVQYYAKLLCLSPKYFGSVISKETGSSAMRWIADYVILQAKSLLAHNKGISIQQVSEKLGFPDQATFARYFKANTGMTPMSYRHSRN